MAADDRQDTGTAGRAVVYVRISDDPDRLERGVERQEEDRRAFAEQLGVEVVEVLRENDTSAFKQRTRVGLPRVFRTPDIAVDHAAYC